MGNKAMWAIRPQSRQYSWMGTALQKVPFYGGGFVPSLQSVFLLWSQRTRTVLFFAIMCCSGTCLQPRLIRHEWGTSFFDVGASLKNCSHRLKKTKPYGSEGPKADKLLAGLE